METAEFDELLSNFDTTADSLEASLTPLLSQPLPTLTTKLPLLSRAKAYTLTTYTILSLLFCTLKLSDIDAKEHPVYKELQRCREYFDKIDKAEKAHEKKEGTGEDERRMRVDQAAAARMVRAGVGGRREQDGSKEGKGKTKRKLDEVEKEDGATPMEVDDEEGGVSLQGSLPSRKKKEGRDKKRKKKSAPKSTGQAMQTLISRSDRRSRKDP